MEGSLRSKITEAMKDAMRAKDEAALGTTRMILAKIKDLDIAARPSGNAGGIGDAEISSALQGMIKQRRESVEMYKKGNRQDLVDKESAEITVIERFLPKQMDEAETTAALKAAIASLGASSIKDMGRVMAEIKKSHAGQMDMAAAGALAKKLLGG